MTIRCDYLHTQLAHLCIGLCVGQGKNRQVRVVKAFFFFLTTRQSQGVFTLNAFCPCGHQRVYMGDRLSPELAGGVNLIGRSAVLK